MFYRLIPATRLQLTSLTGHLKGKNLISTRLQKYTNQVILADRFPEPALLNFGDIFDETKLFRDGPTTLFLNYVFAYAYRIQMTIMDQNGLIARRC